MPEPASQKTLRKSDRTPMVEPGTAPGGAAAAAQPFQQARIGYQSLALR